MAVILNKALHTDLFKVSKDSHNVPTEFQLLPYGQIRLEGEAPISLDHDSMNMVINTFKRRGNDMVIDYEHQTLNGIQAPAAGWIKRLINRGQQGLWAAVDWTNKAKSYLANKEYRYFSPVFHVRDSDRKIIQVMNAALTNAPKINNLTPIVAKYDMNNSRPLDEATLKVAKMMGVTEEDIRKYGQDRPDNFFSESDGEDAFQMVAKMVGLSDEVIQKYGPKSGFNL